MLDRGIKRLEIARNLLGLSQKENVLARIKTMPIKEQNHLRGLVDWVEDYERHESKLGDKNGF